MPVRVQRAARKNTDWPISSSITSLQLGQRWPSRWVFTYSLISESELSAGSACFDASILRHPQEVTDFAIARLIREHASWYFVITSRMLRCRIR